MRSIRKGVLRNFPDFTGKHCARVSFLIKFFKKGDPGTGVFL